MVESSFVALNPLRRPGCVAMAATSAAGDGIGGQVAARLALEHFQEGIMQHAGAAAHSPPTADERAITLLESGFKAANSGVYAFGHKLAAGGRMTSVLLAMVLLDGVIAAGRVGGGGVYLMRAGSLFPFFHEPTEFERQARSHANDNFVGAHALVSVELASVPLQPYDRIVGTSMSIDRNVQSELGAALEEYPQGVLPDFTLLMQHVMGRTTELPFATLLVAGEESVFLDAPATFS